MNLQEAIAVRAANLRGEEVPPHQLSRALVVIRRGNAISMGRRQVWPLEPVSMVQVERANAILAYRLALACGMFEEWRKAA